APADPAGHDDGPRRRLHDISPTAGHGKPAQHKTQFLNTTKAPETNRSPEPSRTVSLWLPRPRRSEHRHPPRSARTAPRTHEAHPPWPPRTGHPIPTTTQPDER